MTGGGGADVGGLLGRPAQGGGLALLLVLLVVVDDRLSGLLRGVDVLGGLVDLRGGGGVHGGRGDLLDLLDGGGRGDLLDGGELLGLLDRGGLLGGGPLVADALGGAVVDGRHRAVAAVVPDGHLEGEGPGGERGLDVVGAVGDELTGVGVQELDVRVVALALDDRSGDAEVLAGALRQAEAAELAGDGDGRGAGGGNGSHGSSSFGGGLGGAGRFGRCVVERDCGLDPEVAFAGLRDEASATRHEGLRIRGRGAVPPTS